MGKLNIAHHKSYHPYRLDNIERVRKDEEAARLKEENEEGRTRVADSEARMEVLRQKAGVSDGISGEVEEEGVANGSIDGSGKLITGTGHINLFQDIEQQSMTQALRTIKKSVPAETEKGVPLAPSEKDLKPWYSEKSSERGKEVINDRRSRDLARQSKADPLTFINSQLSSSSSSSSSRPNQRFNNSNPSSARNRMPPPPAPGPSSSPPSSIASRLTRESSERERALALIARKKREMRGSETPSTVHGGSEYGDVFNREDVREAYAQRERGRGHRVVRDRGW